MLFKDGRDLGQVEADAGEMRILERDLDDQVALRGAAVGGGFVLCPRKLRSDRYVGAAADAGHGPQKCLQPARIGVERAEEVLFSRRFALRLAGPQGRGEIVPVPVKPAVGHLENAADIRRLVLVKEQIGGGRVRVRAVLPLEKSERHQRVEKIAGGPRMQAQAAGERFERLRAARQFGEDLHFNCAEKRLRGPEGQAGLQNVIGAWCGRTHLVLSFDSIRFSLRERSRTTRHRAASGWVKKAYTSECAKFTGSRCWIGGPFFRPMKWSRKEYDPSSFRQSGA